MEADNWPQSIERISCCCPGTSASRSLPLSTRLSVISFTARMRSPRVGAVPVLVAVSGVYLMLTYLTFRGQRRGRP